ncbi:MAG: type I-A CRISPR-associated protein Cas7/Csa2 [Thermoprotei archaeon]|nr:MAG: type I-A CRISPR-associated protein Cas7/Csa2 [Thermoprotei archaeon]
MVYLSLSARILLNVEALNMVESIGNFVRHRRAPIIVPASKGFVLKYVPAISGESLAHAYQEVVARVASEVGLSVCSNCRAGYFIKHADDSVLEEWAKEAQRKGSIEFEKTVIQRCVVEDIGGFLYAGREPVKRTSRFQVGYMIPALDAITSTAIEAQFHVRYARVPEQQSIYNVEVGSATYAFGFNLDVDGIGVLSSGSRELAVSKEERVKRIEVAVKALSVMLASALFGAKRTRFYPSWKVLSAVAAVSDPIPVTAEPPHTRQYVANTAEKVESVKKLLKTGSLKIDEKVWVGYFRSKEDDVGEVKGAEEVRDVTTLTSRALEVILEYIK